MMREAVAYVHEIKCPSCGLQFSGYMEILPDGRGVADCPRCGAAISQPLPAHFVPQIAPSDFHSPAHPHMHVSHYPGLYNQPKRPPRLDLSDLFRVFISPTKAFRSLYLATNLERAMSLVVVFSILSAVVSTVISAGLNEILGHAVVDALEASFTVFASFAVSMLAFLVFGLSAAVIARTFFGGRGERSATITLVGYCYPAYVIISILLLLILSLGFGGLDSLNIDTWTSSELNRSIIVGAALLFLVLAALVWLLLVTSRAISVANDISMSEALLTAVLSAIASGLVFVIAGSVMRLPAGLSF